MARIFTEHFESNKKTVVTNERLVQLFKLSLQISDLVIGQELVGDEYRYLKGAVESNLRLKGFVNWGEE